MSNILKYNGLLREKHRLLTLDYCRFHQILQRTKITCTSVPATRNRFIKVEQSSSITSYQHHCFSAISNESCHKTGRQCSLSHLRQSQIFYHMFLRTLTSNAAGISNSYFRNFGELIPDRYNRLLKWKAKLQSDVQLLKGLLSRSSALSVSALDKVLGLKDHITLFQKTQSRQNQQNSNDSGNEQPNNSNEPENTILTFIGSLVGILIVLALTLSSIAPLQTISWAIFVNELLAKGEVKYLSVTIYDSASGRASNSQSAEDVVSVYLHDGAIVNGKMVGREIRNPFKLRVSDINKLEEKLLEAEDALKIDPFDRVPIKYTRSNEDERRAIMNLAFLALGGLFLMYLMKKQTSFNPFSSMSQPKFTVVQKDGGKGVTFKDVAGLSEAKLELMEFVDYLKRPDRYQRLGARVPKGALLLGPPGCGKTFLAKAVATEANVPFLVMAGSEFIEMIGGLGAARVRNLFKEARKRAPCIIYIDELDAIGKKRSDGLSGAGGEQDQTLNQLLVEMDGMGTQKGVIMLSSTNRADVLDKALLRPGRFDRHILIDYPTLIERKQIFEVHLSSLTLQKEPETYSRRLAQLSPGMSGADIANVCNEAALYAARLKKSHVDRESFEYAIERIVAGAAKTNTFMAKEERSVVAFHESGHALTGWLLEHTDALLKVSIVPRTNAALGFAMYLPTDFKLFSEQQLFDRMCMALGGRAAEALIFNRVTTGAHDDLNRVTKMAYAQIRTYGMNAKVGNVSFPEVDTGELGRRPYSQTFQAMIDEEVRQLVTRAYRATEELLSQNQNKLKLLATTLLKEEVLNYKDVETLLGPPPFGPKQTVDIDQFDSMEVNEEMSDDDKQKPRRQHREDEDRGSD